MYEPIKYPAECFAPPIEGHLGLNPKDWPAECCEIIEDLREAYNRAKDEELEDERAAIYGNYKHTYDD